MSIWSQCVCFCLYKFLVFFSFPEYHIHRLVLRKNNIEFEGEWTVKLKQDSKTDDKIVAPYGPWKWIPILSWKWYNTVERAQILKSAIPKNESKVLWSYMVCLIFLTFIWEMGGNTHVTRFSWSINMIVSVYCLIEQNVLSRWLSNTTIRIRLH